MRARAIFALACGAGLLAAPGARAEKMAAASPPATVAAASPGSASVAASGSGGKDTRAPEQLRKEVLDRMRTLRAWRIVEELKLDEATSARLFPILSRYDDRELALANEKRDIMREIRAQVETARPDEGKLSKAIDRLMETRARRHALQDERFKEMRKVLTPTQQAKLALLLPRLEREFARWIHDVAGKHGDE